MVLAPADRRNSEEQIAGCLLGTAAGDAMGLPYEGISRRRQQKMFPQIDGHRFIWNHGMWSDDTEHTCMVAQALISSKGDPDKFAHTLAGMLRIWLLGLPAGIGFATLRAIIKSWIGFSPARSGVYSAGNGPAMRSAIIGVVYGHDENLMRSLVRASTRVTHTDPRAEHGAVAVALAAWMSANASGNEVDPDDYFNRLSMMLSHDNADELLTLISLALKSGKANQSAQEFADSLGLQKGVTGYVNHTVPVVIQVWLRHQRRYHEGILEIIRCGGDTDTTAAILGGIIGSSVGTDGIPSLWISHICEFPRNVQWLRRLAHQLAVGECKTSCTKTVCLFVPALVARNVLFFIVVLLHGFRRLLPPY